MKKFSLSLFGVILTFLFLSNVPALATTYNLIYEFDGDLPSDVIYGTVDVSENGSGDLDFIVAYNDTENPLGVDADIHELYLNIESSFTNLSIISDNHPNEPYTSVDPATIAGGGGISIDLWEANFGNGSGPTGNGTLQYATFTLSADEVLSTSDLLGFSNNNIPEDVFVAVHFQSTLPDPPGSETIGGIPDDLPFVPIPEPGTMMLLGFGLIGLAGIGRRKIKK